MTEPFLGDGFEEDRFKQDPAYRWEYLADFLNFGESDWDRIQSTADILRPKILSIVEVLYDNFLKYEPTAKLYRDDNGEIDEDLLEDRIEGFELWFERIFDCGNRAEYVTYLAKVGEIHTEGMGFETMVVDETQLDPTFSRLFDRIAEELTEGIDDAERLAACLSAWQRFFTIQLSIFRMAYSDS